MLGPSGMALQIRLIQFRKTHAETKIVCHRFAGNKAFCHIEPVHAKPDPLDTATPLELLVDIPHFKTRAPLDSLGDYCL